jgi:hypothetical protein
MNNCPEYLTRECAKLEEAESTKLEAWAHVQQLQTIFYPESVLVIALQLLPLMKLQNHNESWKQSAMENQYRMWQPQNS